MMKMKFLLTVLSLLLVISMALVGCGEETLTPTDISASGIQHEMKEEEETPVESVLVDEAVQKDAKEKGTIQENDAEKVIKQEENQTESTVVDQSQKDATSKETQGIHADEPEYIPPSFTSMAGFKSWLQNGGIEEEKRADLLNSVKTSSTFSTTTYCRPKIGDGNDMFTISKIDAYPYSVVYRYGFVKNSDVNGLEITTYIAPAYMKAAENTMHQMYNEINNVDTRAFDKYGSSTANGITYYYYHFPKNNGTMIHWQINGNTYYAVYYGDYDQINQILPMLELEQVSYKVNDNVEVK